MGGQNSLFPGRLGFPLAYEELRVLDIPRGDGVLMYSEPLNAVPQHLHRVKPAAARTLRARSLLDVHTTGSSRGANSGNVNTERSLGDPPGVIVVCPVDSLKLLLRPAG